MNGTRAHEQARAFDLSVRAAWLLVAFFCAASLAIRIAYWLELQASDIHVLLFSESLDSFIYHDWAQRIAAGDLLLGDKLFTLSPFYSYVLALVYLVTGPGMFAAILVQLLLGVAGVALMYAAGSALFNRLTGVLAAGLTAFYGYYLLVEGLLLSEAFLPVATAFFLFWTARAMKQSKLWHFALSGLLLGFLFSIRPQYFLVVILLPLFGLILAGRRSRPDLPDRKTMARRLACGALGAALMVAPLAIRNFAATGEPVLLTSAGGVNFYIGNGPDATGTWLVPHGFRMTQAGMFEDFARAAGGTEFEAAHSAHWFKKGLEAIADDPLRWLRIMGRKAALFWNKFEVPVNFDISLFEKHLSSTRFAFIPFFAVGALGLLGMVLALQGRRAGWLLVVLLGYFAGMILFFVSARYRVAALPCIILFAAFGTERVLAMVRTRKWGSLATSGVVLLLALVLTLWNLAPPVAAASQANQYRYMAYHFGRNGDIARAEKWAREAMRVEPNNPESWATLIMALFDSRRLVEAERAALQALKIAPEHPGLWMLYGTVLEGAGRKDAARKAFDKARSLGGPNQNR